MNTSETTDKIIPAFIDAQKDLKNTKKNKKGRWDYASIDAILDDVRPILALNGLAITCDYGFQVKDDAAQNGTVTALTRLYHASGQWLQYELQMPIGNASSGSLQQQVGATCTYARKYQISGILGIAPTDLDDVDAAPEPKPEKLIDENGLRKLNATMKQKQISQAELKKRLGVKSLDEIKAKDAATVFSTVKNMGTSNVD